MTARLIVGIVAAVAFLALAALTPRLWRRWRPRTISVDRVGWRVKRGVLASALVASVLVAGYGGGPHLACVGGGLDLGISRDDGECTGITDGGYSFGGGFADVGDDTRRRLDRVTAALKKQNDAVDGDFVYVAFLAPLTSSLSGPRVVHELAGAVAADRWINGTNRGAPKIKLLLAHMGSQEKQWRSVVDKLVALKDGDPPLVAVVGLGLSNDYTKAAVGALADAGIPMVADLITATDIGRGREGFHRVSYSNAAQFDALFTHLSKAKVDLRGAVVLQSDDPADSYARSAARAITDRLAGRPRPEEFGGNEGDMANQFREISRNLCHGPPPIVFYAGRSRYLANLLTKLDDVNCPTTVVTASDAAVLRMRTTDDTARRAWGIADASAVLARGKVTLLYTALADPALLAGRKELDALTKTLPLVGGERNDLTTGWAIDAWDAVRVAAEWTWAARAVLADGRVPAAKDVARASTSRFANADDPFAGAGGDLWFDRDGERGGPNPTVLQLIGGGSVRVCRSGACA